MTEEILEHILHNHEWHPEDKVKLTEVLAKAEHFDSEQEIIQEINNRLIYIGTIPGSTNTLSLVQDPKGMDENNGLRLFKRQTSIGTEEEGHELRVEYKWLHYLKDFPGVPKIYEFYNYFPRPARHKLEYDTPRRSLLKEFIIGDVYQPEKHPDVKPKLKELVKEIKNNNVKLQRDFDTTDVIIDKDGNPHIVDFELAEYHPPLKKRIDEKARDLLETAITGAKGFAAGYLFGRGFGVGYTYGLWKSKHPEAEFLPFLQHPAFHYFGIFAGIFGALYTFNVVNSFKRKR